MTLAKKFFPHAVKKHPDFVFGYPLLIRILLNTGVHSPLMFFVNNFHTACAEGSHPGSDYERLLWRKQTLGW